MKSRWTLLDGMTGLSNAPPSIPAPMLFVHDYDSWLMLHGLCAVHWFAHADLWSMPDGQ